MQLQGITFTDLAVLVVAVEAITEAIFRAAPLQSSREWIINHSRWLYSERMQSHLLECKYCTSFWVGATLFVVYNSFESQVVLWFMYLIAVPRLANYLHLPISYIRDKQLNLRIERNRGGK